MEEYSVELRSVVKKFGDVIAVNDIDLKVKKGEFLTLLGPSGCGKTTTLRMIAGLEVPDQGTVLLDGEEVNDVPANQRDTSTVFQNLALFPHLTVSENIAFGLKCKKVSQVEIKPRLEQALELVKLQGYGKRRPAQLSGGQQQRVALARSLVLQPVVLLLDEPMASLDRKLSEEMQIELKRIQSSVGITFIYVTHDQAMALSTSDRIALMKDGIIVQVGTPNEIYEMPKTRFAADFMGIANIFHGKIDKRHGKTSDLVTDNGLKVTVPNREDLIIEDANDISVSIRPEAIKVYRQAPQNDGRNVYKGRLNEHIYQGEKIELRVALESGENVIARLNKDQDGAAWDKGCEVYLELLPERCIVLLED